MHALSIATFVLLSAAVTAPAAGYVVPRKETPSTYAEGYLEDYNTYHTRYLAIGCQYQHNNATFFNACCHPLLATENLETARPSYCIPSTSASASASAAEATSTVTTPADGDNGDDSDDDDSDDCDDGDDDDSASSSAAFTPSATSSSTSETFSSTSSFEPTTSSESTPTPTSTPEAVQTTTSSSSAQATPTSVDTSTGSSEVFTGGHATYFTQNGVAGACGQVHSDSDFIVALDQDRYGDSGATSQYCGKTVSITGLGKTVQATVADDCPTCDNENSLDMSVGLFQEFASLDMGEFDITWSFV
ncbi:RlpA-like double-psi beta-barrel-protein domain-containing protein-containing protein [Lentinula detonsa]|uniref:RlpA-like double-psi beta-barrel-protein domain-containing protein-containing protein n=1 Tax=Lentinula detonsa TaxID=2804962 RepID=A0A9W8P1D5_9AGAR|nr:RlpA-like double-psi beta-barrel-protein domain-containing protein-containing protein [Lentinula detonsa]